MAIANSLVDLPPNDLPLLSKSSGVVCEYHKEEDKVGHIYCSFTVYQMETPAL